MLCYVAGRRKVAQSPLAHSQPNVTPEATVTMTMESSAPMVAPPGRPVKIVNIVKQVKAPKNWTPSIYEEILHFPKHEERLKRLQDGQYQNLKNTRWHDDEPVPFLPGVRIDFYENYLGLYRHNTGEYWFLWRLVEPNILETRSLVDAWRQGYQGSYEERGDEPYWYIDGSEEDECPPSEWETHHIEFVVKELEYFNRLSVQLCGFFPYPLYYC